MHAFKSYENFETLVKELSSISPAIEEILTDDHGKQPTNTDNAALLLIDKIKNDFPSIFNDKYPATSAISVSGFEIGYKFPGQLSFGWRIETKEGSGEDGNDNVIYKARVTMNSNPVIAGKTAVMVNCANLGFNLREDVRNHHEEGNNKNKR